jgi:3-(3-hydroxy-phenyl)propionate hydroxylase
MSTSALPVLIVGAGPVGLTLAWALHGAGVPVRVFEGEAAIPDELRASTFHPPTLDMFDASGVTAELVAAGRVTPEWQVRMHETGERVVFDLSVLRGDTGHPYRLQCRQARLCEALLRRLPADTVRFSSQVEAAGQEDGRAWVQTRAAMGAARVEGAFVVGCDGARSVVRESMGSRLEGKTYPEHTVLATTRLPFEEHIDGLSGVNYVWERRGTVSLLRLPELWRVSLHPRAGETPEAALEDDAIASRIAALVPGADPHPIEEKRIYRIHRRIASSYQRGRLALAGDAAHLNSPKGGMGMNGGIHDALDLADTLARAMDGGDAEVLLAGYERRRRPVAAEEILAQADANRARMNETDPARRSERLAELRAISSDPSRARTFLRRSSMIEGLKRARLAA